MENTENKAVFFLEENGRYGLLLGLNFNPEECEMFHGQARDFMKRKNRSVKDLSYSPLWSPLQRGMNMVFDKKYTGFIWTKKQKEVAKNGRTNSTEPTGS